MKVQQAESVPDPGYPDRHQFKACAKALGLVVLGTGGLLAAGCSPSRMGGEPPAAPVCEPPGSGEVRLRGDVAVVPKPVPPRLGGDLPAEPAKP